MSKTAFVFAGGGSLGAVQVGMLHALVAHGVKADFVVGSSVGAINGAYFAGNPTLDGVMALENLWLNIRRRDVFPLGWRTAASLLWRRDFLVSSDGLRSLIEMHLPYRQLEDAQVPVHVIATDLLSGAAVVLSRGPAAEAIIASSAIPAAFAPISIDGRYLVDGAITSNTPVRAAISLGAQRLVVLPTGFACALQNSANRSHGQRVACADPAHRSAACGRIGGRRPGDHFCDRPHAVSTRGVSLRFLAHRRAHQECDREHPQLDRLRWA